MMILAFLFLVLPPDPAVLASADLLYNQGSVQEALRVLSEHDWTGNPGAALLLEACSDTTWLSQGSTPLPDEGTIEFCLLIPGRTPGERIRLLLPVPVSSEWQEVSGAECSVAGMDSVVIVSPEENGGGTQQLFVEGVVLDSVLVTWSVGYRLAPQALDLRGPGRDEAMVPPLEDNHESASYLRSLGWVSWTDALYAETRSVTVGVPNPLDLLDRALAYAGMFSQDAWPVPLPQVHFENPSLMALRGIRRGSFNSSCLLAVMLRTSGIPARVVPGFLRDGPFFVCLAYIQPFGWVPADSRSGTAGEMPSGFLSTSFCITDPSPHAFETFENGLTGVLPRGEALRDGVLLAIPVSDISRGFSWRVR
jgi:hypothetical protein